MVLGKLLVPGRPTNLDYSRARAALAEGAGAGCLDIFSLVYRISLLSPSLWETARYRLKYCLKGPLNPNQPTNQPTPTQGKKTYVLLSASYKRDSITLRVNNEELLYPVTSFFIFSSAHYD